MAASLNQLLQEAVLELERITGQSIGDLRGASNYRLALYQVALLAAIPAGGTGTGDGGPAVDEEARDAAQAAQDNVDALETVVAGKASSADLTALARRVTSLETGTGGGTPDTTGGGDSGGGSSSYYLPAAATPIGSGPFYFDPSGANSVAFNRSGTGTWSYITDEVEGSVLQSDVLTDNNLAIARARVTASATGKVSFRVNVSGEAEYDYFAGEIVGAEQNSREAVLLVGNDGSKPQNTWLDGELIVPRAGDYELRFIYRKDPSGAVGRDNARVASVVLGASLAYTPA